MEKERIIFQLQKVKDPVTGQDIMAVGLVENVEIEGNNVNITLSVPSLQMDSKEQLNFAIMEAVLQKYPEAEVNLHFKARNPNAAPTNTLPHIKNIIAVASGKGGVGKSTVSVNLALGLKALGAKVGLMDADVYGPSIPTMLGLVGERPMVQDVYGKAKIVPLMGHGMQCISIGNIIEPEQAVVLRGPRLGGIIKQFINDVLWDELDFLVIDLPPGTGDVQLTLVQSIPITGVVMVTTPQEVAVADAIKAMNMFALPNIDVPILGVVENMAWFTPAELPNNKYFIFGEGGGKQLAKMSNSVLLGQIPIVQSIREGGDTGKPAVLNLDSTTGKSFLSVAQKTLQQVAIRNEHLGPTKVVQME